VVFHTAADIRIIFRMVYKEVLSEIPEDEFIEAAEITFEASGSLDRLSKPETRLARRAFPGLTDMAFYLRLEPALHLKNWIDVSHRFSYGSDRHTGVIRHNLVLDEWFQQQITSGGRDIDLADTYLWLKNLNRRDLKKIIKSYLQQAQDEYKRSDQDDSDFRTAEGDKLIREYPAFDAFQQFLDQRLAEQEVPENVAQEVVLGAIAISETLEMADFYKHADFLVDRVKG
jgi:hypothetical protein